MTAKPRKTKGNHHGSSVCFDPFALLAKRGSISQEDFADRIKISVVTYRVAERGKYVSHPVGIKIRRFTNIEFSYYTPPAEKYVPVRDLKKTNYKYNPITCLQDKALGERDCPLFAGRMCLVKWHDPGGDGYSPGWVYDRPNRVLVVHSVTNNRRLWWEYNLTGIQDSEERWEKPTHVWTEVSHEFPALGNHRPGIILYRIDMAPLVSASGLNQVVEFFIPNDVGKRLADGEETTIFWRKTLEKSEFAPEARPLISSQKPFEDLGFVIVAAAYDP